MPMSRSVRYAWPLVLLSCLGPTRPAVAIDELICLGGISVRPPLPPAPVHTQQLAKLTDEVNKAEATWAENQDHLFYWWNQATEKDCPPLRRVNKPGVSAACKEILQNIVLFADKGRELHSSLVSKEIAVEYFF